jgi:hypothetical protein
MDNKSKSGDSEIKAAKKAALKKFFNVKKGQKAAKKAKKSTPISLLKKETLV